MNNQLKALYQQMEIVATVLERFEIWKQIKAIEKQIEASRDQSPTFH